MLPAPLLAAARTLAEQALDQTITITRPTRTSDGAGGSSESLSTIATVRGSIAQPSGQLLQNYAYRVAALDTWQVWLPIGTDVREGDLLSVTGLTQEQVRVQVLLSPRSYATTLTLLASAVV